MGPPVIDLAAMSALTALSCAESEDLLLLPTPQRWDPTLSPTFMYEAGAGQGQVQGQGQGQARQQQQRRPLHQVPFWGLQQLGVDMHLLISFLVTGPLLPPPPDPASPAAAAGPLPQLHELEQQLALLPQLSDLRVLNTLPQHLQPHLWQLTSLTRLQLLGGCICVERRGSLSCGVSFLGVKCRAVAAAPSHLQLLGGWSPWS